MKCPYCEQIMELGSIITSADSFVYWLPNDEKLINPLLWSRKTIGQKKGVLFSKKLSYRKISAFICRKCNKCIFDF